MKNLLSARPRHSYFLAGLTLLSFSGFACSGGDEGTDSGGSGNSSGTGTGGFTSVGTGGSANSGGDSSLPGESGGSSGVTGGSSGVGGASGDGGTTGNGGEMGSGGADVGSGGSAGAGGNLGSGGGGMVGDGSCNESELLAFPCAEGYGKYTTGGRGGEVYEVTTLNSSGSGSLGDALSKSGRTIVFRVSGTINGRFNVPDNTTIAGQTAPGDGITIFGQLGVGSNNIIRYIRVRFDGNGDEDAMGTRYDENIIIDHVSASWSRDEVLSIYHCENVTIQWTMISEACPNEGTDSHRFGMIWGSENSTYHHNLIAHNENRTPRLASGCGHNDLRNNVIYNWGYGGSYGGERVQSGSSFVGSWINMVGNYFKPGPGSEDRSRIVAPSSRGSGDEGNWHVSGNFMDGDSSVTSNNWLGVRGNEYIKMDSPWDAMAINEQSPQDAYEDVLADVGASLPARDSIDTRIINDVRDGTASNGNDGFLSCPADTVLPTLSSAPAPADSDHDGMPDDWENANGLNPNSADDRNQTWGPGYTMLEKYLNSLDSF